MTHRNVYVFTLLFNLRFQNFKRVESIRTLTGRGKSLKIVRLKKIRFFFSKTITETGFFLI
jgi:hypothetical protein